MTDAETMELDLELDALLEQPASPTLANDDTKVQLVADEEIDRFEALPRPTALFLHGVDDMSTKDITSYCNHPLLQKVEWINDSACNLAFATREQAQEALQSLLLDPSVEVQHRQLVAAKPYVKEDVTHELFIRISTDEDVKERGARTRSRYYLIHGVEEDESTISEERKEARKSHRERMAKSGGDGRSVFSRLGKTVDRRSLSPDAQRERRSLSPNHRRQEEDNVVREIPSHLKSRLGNIKS
ncbi:hypothetical protein INT47_013152 [Mucor saturninus]|uniref:Uncharacterized protein n=1 Tax=Mucor saturninus TaxID=64648 RepID=A0A8H7V0M5_9FUNG|nr:hypothetical protein INT47_013152 [Mucor saturninus]